MSFGFKVLRKPELHWCCVQWSPLVLAVTKNSVCILRRLQKYADVFGLDYRQCVT
jgi:hypothetical protein